MWLIRLYYYINSGKRTKRFQRNSDMDGGGTHKNEPVNRLQTLWGNWKWNRIKCGPEAAQF